MWANSVFLFLPPNGCFFSKPWGFLYKDILIQLHSLNSDTVCVLTQNSSDSAAFLTLPTLLSYIASKNKNALEQPAYKKKTNKKKPVDLIFLIKIPEPIN